MDLAKFDVPGDPVVRDIFDNGKTTLLFVGRVIPNKKFEDVIKTFHFYRKRFNPNSQLILAGDYRGMERYSGLARGPRRAAGASGRPLHAGTSISTSS